jgi:hypothetical protein
LITDAGDGDVESRQLWDNLVRKLVSSPIGLDDRRNFGLDELADALRNGAFFRIEQIGDPVEVALIGGGTNSFLRAQEAAVGVISSLHQIAALVRSAGLRGECIGRRGPGYRAPHRNCPAGRSGRNSSQWAADAFLATCLPGPAYAFAQLGQAVAQPVTQNRHRLVDVFFVSSRCP